MDFALTDVQGSIRETIRKFVIKECEREAIKKQDEEGLFPEGLFNTICELGFCGLTVPEEFGGMGPDTLAAAIVAEELATIYPSLSGAFIAAAFWGGRLIEQLASPEQKAALLPGCVEGRTLVSLALREPDDAYGTTAGSTRARETGDGFVLDGCKAFVPLAERAAYLVVPARTTEGEEGLTLFLVPSQAEGLTIKAAEKVGFDSLSLCEVNLTGVSISHGDVLGGKAWINRAAEQMDKVNETAYLGMAVLASGMARGAFEYALRYAQEREQFGRPIASFGGVKLLLADAGLDIHAARLMTYQACWKADVSRECLREARLARITAARTAKLAAVNCTQILGGYGYASEYDAQRYMRDALVLMGGIESPEVLKDAVDSLPDIG